LEGARQVLIEDFSETAEVVGALREYVWEHARLRSRVVEGKEQEGVKFQDYFKQDEPIRNIPSHRALALFRGRREGILRLSLVVDEPTESAAPPPLAPCEKKIADHFHVRDEGKPADQWLLGTVKQAWSDRICPRLESELEVRLREKADEEAINVFGRNLRDLLLAAPAGQRATMGLDPGYRTGVKVVVVDITGKLVAATSIYPHEPRKHWDQSIETLAQLAVAHQVELVAIGNGTASRETDRLVSELMTRHLELKLTKVLVSEAGASVYSASVVASKELPDLDVSLRGAVSIARRLQDPLAELVKIEPRSIGVGQYQHDVSQSLLARRLDGVVEDCVNAVGVDVNTASPSLLARVSGLNQGLALGIVGFRDQHGAFSNRQQLLSVPRLGPKAFEQAAGFLRIIGGDHPLDASAVHPEAYPVVERIMRATQRDIGQLIGAVEFLHGLNPSDFIDLQFGEPTVKDILSELEKPGRDPRPEFKTAAFKEEIQNVADLKAGMELEGVVTNVTNFGAFVDVGVHQDGLVHISQLANRFVKDPRMVVKTGDIVKVKVLEVDEKRQRISLTMRSREAPSPRPARRAPKPGVRQVGAVAPQKEGVAETRPSRPPRPRRPAGRPVGQERAPSPPAAPPVAQPRPAAPPTDRRAKAPREQRPSRPPQTAMAAAFAKLGVFPKSSPTQEEGDGQ
jgi:uncharacterized protein